MPSAQEREVDIVVPSRAGDTLGIDDATSSPPAAQTTTTLSDSMQASHTRSERPMMGHNAASTLVQPDYPKVFFDPTTDLLMVHPVVNQAGDSFEKSSVRDASVTYYPNRALAAIIQRETSAVSTRPTALASIRRMDSALKSGWNRLVGNSAFPSNYRPLPDVFYCPIMCELMVDPVIAPDGNSYERQAIENWIRANGTSPVTREALTLSQLRPNNALYDLIQSEKKRTPDSMHPSIRRWKESTAMTSRLPLTETTTAPDWAPELASSASSPTPITEAEILQRRRQQPRDQQKLVIVLIITLIVSFLFLPYVAAVVAAYIAISFFVMCNSSNEEGQDQGNATGA
jgi:U-box domain